MHGHPDGAEAYPSQGGYLQHSETARLWLHPATLPQPQRTWGDDRAALVWASLMADAKAAGRPRSALDMIIAAVAVAHACVVVTDNEKDFVGLQVVNPMRGSTQS